MNKLTPILLFLIFISCGGPKRECSLKYKSTDKVYLIKESVEAVVNYRIHAIYHDSTISELPCRYRVSYVKNDGETITRLAYENEIK
ncbi:MAG: hypothetical protein ABII90_16300 [Bacteroidota bacterium]